jgi:hypothetical protein
MASPRNYADKLQSDDFDQLFREATHPKEKLRFLAFVHLKDGQSARTVANTVQVDQSSVHRWLRNYEAKGVDGLREQPGRGRKRPFNSEVRHPIDVSVFASPRLVT